MKGKIFNYKGLHGGVEFAVEYTGLSKSSIYKRVEKNIIPHSRLPNSNKLIFHADLLDAWIRKNSNIDLNKF